MLLHLLWTRHAMVCAGCLFLPHTHPCLCAAALTVCLLPLPHSPVAALNAEHTVAANLVQGISNHLTNTVIVTGRNGGNVLQQQQQQQQQQRTTSPGQTRCAAGPGTK
jgi:hypothetical protein